MVSLNWYHISDIKKIDMVTKLICQLPDVDAFGRKGRLSFDPECVQDLGWTPNDWKYKFNPDHVKGYCRFGTEHAQTEISPNGVEIQRQVRLLKVSYVTYNSTHSDQISIFNYFQIIRYLIKLWVHIIL